MSALTGSDVIHMATVLEDCIDQLVILGRIMPVAYREKPTATQVIIVSVNYVIKLIFFLNIEYLVNGHI